MTGGDDINFRFSATKYGQLLLAIRQSGTPNVNDQSGLEIYEPVKYSFLFGRISRLNFSKFRKFELC